MERLPLEVRGIIAGFMSGHPFFRNRWLAPWLNRPFEVRLIGSLMDSRRGDGTAVRPPGYYRTARQDPERGVRATRESTVFVYRSITISVRSHRKWRPAFFRDDDDSLVCFESHSPLGTIWSPLQDMDAMIGYWRPTTIIMTPTALLRAHCDAIDQEMIPIPVRPSKQFNPDQIQS